MNVLRLSASRALPSLLRPTTLRPISTTAPLLMGGHSPTFHETKMHYPKNPDPFEKHRSDAMEKIFEVPPIEVDGDVAVCEGGAGALGHPVEYITLKVHSSTDRLAGVCKYCGLRFVGKKHSH